MNNIINWFESTFENGEKLTALIVSVVIFILLALFKNKISKLLLSIFSKLFLKNKDEYRQPLFDSLLKPLSTFFLALGIFCLTYINLPKNSILKTFKIVVILIICWAFVNYLSNNLFLLFHFGKNADSKMNTTVIKFISNILKIVVISFAVVMVISELGYNINGLLTGIGVGGLAVSLAAQEAVADLIGGFVIVFDKPFIVGDMIQTPDLMGFVEDVTMRSTKIKTLEDSIVTVPNSKLADSAIVNLSRIEKRYIDIEIGVEYSTPNSVIDKCKEDIYEYLKGNDEILDEPLRVNVAKLDDSAITIRLTCYSSNPDLNEYLRLMDEINLKLKDIVENNGTSFAFPSTSIYIEKN